MSQISATPDFSLVLHFGPVMSRLSNADFFEFCRLNPEFRIERTKDGDLEIMPPTGGNTGRRNSSIATQLGIWSERDGTGLSFDSSTLFRLPNGAFRSPDASWIRGERWAALSEQDREIFPPLTPDFVVELRSPSDRLEALRAKLREYLENGVRLGWLVDPTARRVEVFRPNAEPLLVENPSEMSADPELPGFVLNLVKVW